MDLVDRPYLLAFPFTSTGQSGVNVVANHPQKLKNHKSQEIRILDRKIAHDVQLSRPKMIQSKCLQVTPPPKSSVSSETVSPARPVVCTIPQPNKIRCSGIFCKPCGGMANRLDPDIVRSQGASTRCPDPVFFEK